MHRTRPSSIALACCLAALLPSAAGAQQPPGRIEIVPLQTRSPANRDVLRGEPQAGREATVAGELRLPAGAPPGQRVPAVVLLHDSAGPGAALDAWAKELNAAGVAAFLLDSFTGRGIADTIADQSRLSGLAVMVDAYHALDWLAAHPRIRPDRVAVMGFSRGATAAVYSATERFARLLGGPDRRFALHIGFYGPCYIAYEGDTRVGAPIRLFHGAEDDYVPAQPCRDYVARLREAGADATLTEYAGARHAFDNPLIPPLFALRSAQTWRNCRLREGPDGAILNAATGAPPRARCTRRRATLAWSAAPMSGTAPRRRPPPAARCGTSWPASSFTDGSAGPPPDRRSAIQVTTGPRSRLGREQLLHQPLAPVPRDRPPGGGLP